MDVIVPGLPRTGTMTLARAFEILGYERVYNRLTINRRPQDLRAWHAALRGEDVDWHNLFDGYRVCIGYPVFLTFRQLLTFYPDAQVVLPIRDFEVWYASSKATLLELDSSFYREPMNQRFRETFFGGDAQASKSAYNQHNDAVVEAAMPRRTLVHRHEDGWGPLCEHLGCAVPPIAYPHRNTKHRFRRRHLPTLGKRFRRKFRF